MSSELTTNAWGIILHHVRDGIVELRWLPGEMTDGGFKATLALLALEAEKVRPSSLLVDASKFSHRPGPGVMQWRDDCVVPRYGSAGVKKIRVPRASGISEHDRSWRQSGGRGPGDFFDCPVF
jgi:hypothetical protein